MPSDTIKEKILKNIKTTLESIKTSSGYENTIASVQRYQVNGQDTSEYPYIIIVQGDDEVAFQGPDPQITRAMTVHFDVFTRQDVVTDPRAGDELMNTLQDDIESALQSDATRGTNADDTGPVEVMPQPPEEGSVDINSIMSVQISYRHQRTDPKLP